MDLETYDTCTGLQLYQSSQNYDLHSIAILFGRQLGLMLLAREQKFGWAFEMNDCQYVYFYSALFIDDLTWKSQGRGFQ